MTEFWTKTDVREKWLETPFDELLATVAEHLIVKERLRNAHGEVVCWKCNGRPATMPSLHCKNCLAEYRQRNGSK